MIFRYNASPIRNIDTLVKTLGVSDHFLYSICSSISEQYIDVEIPKKDGTSRLINIPKPAIKTLQRKINSRIFCHIIYPDYLYGGIKNKDYHKNALVHSGASQIINLDIENFFPNTRKSEVFNIFKNLLNFSDDVSRYLSEICTLRDALPQGACTSTHIANLIFFQKEPELYKKFKLQNLNYTRLIDDITVSSTKKLSTKKTSAIISSVQSLIGIKKFNLKKSKTKITTVGNPSAPAKITGLTLVQKNRLSLSSNEICSINKDVHVCHINGKINQYGEEYLNQHNKASGKVAKLSQIKHPNSEPLRDKLREVLPYLDNDQIQKIKYKIRDIKKKSKSHKNKESYHRYFYEICVLLNIYQRTHRKEAIFLRKELFKYKPIIYKIDIKNGNI